VGSTNTWAGQYICDALGTLGNQYNPKIFQSAANTIIVWEDDRFVSFSGYGIFGMKIDPTTGVKDPGWPANASGTADWEGVAIILNNFNEYWPNLQVIRYNNGSDALVVWEDWREPGPPYQGSDLRYYDVDGFTP
jgi:hypothetical protein